jgi:sensor histidine kinase YesM
MAPGAAAGVGLSNTRARLDELYGGDYRFDLTGGEGDGLTVSLAIPLRRAEAPS